MFNLRFNMQFKNKFFFFWNYCLNIALWLRGEGVSCKFLLYCWICFWAYEYMSLICKFFFLKLLFEYCTIDFNDKAMRFCSPDCSFWYRLIDLLNKQLALPFLVCLFQGLNYIFVILFACFINAFSNHKLPFAL